MNGTSTTFRTKRLSDLLDVIDTLAFNRINNSETLATMDKKDLAFEETMRAAAMREVVGMIRKEFKIDHDLCEQLLKAKSNKGVKI